MAYGTPFPVNPTLTAISIGYSNPTIYYIADQVMPRRPVPNSAFKWMYHPIGEAFTVPNTEVGRLGRVERVEFTGEFRDGSVTDYGLEDAVPISDINSAASMRAAGLGTFNPMDQAVEGLTDLLSVDREMRVAAMVQNPNNYGTKMRLVMSGSDMFSDPTSDPIGVIKAALSATLIFRPNTAAMSRPTWDIVSSHPKLVNAVRGNVTGQGIITTDEFAKLFGLSKVLIGEAFSNVARRGQALDIRRIWGNSISLLFINPAVGPEAGTTWGMTCCYGTRFAGDWYDRNAGLEGAQVIRLGERCREIVTAPEVGFLLQNVVTPAI